MEVSRNKLTYFHIPKTGGRFLSANTIDIFKADLINRNIPIIDKVGRSRHQSFYHLENDILAKPMVTLRNPVDRTISHYFYILENKLTKDINQDKVNFFNYINSNKCIIDNYQAKFISCNLDKLDLTDEDLPQEVNIDTINNRLFKVFYLIKTEDINKEMCNRILLDSYIDHDIEPNINLINKVFNKEYFINPESKIFKESLSKKEISMIENIVNIDMEIYETSKFFRLEN